MNIKELLDKVKNNLIIDFYDDDKLLEGFIAAAVDYAEKFQHTGEGYYSTHNMPKSTERAVIMLASHFYESRDGSTGGFFADNVQAARNSYDTVNCLLRMDKDWKV